jgi:hypothetical protein
MLVNQMASSTVHREPREGSWKAHPGSCRFRNIHDRIADRKDVIHLPAKIQVRFKKLGKAGFDK